MKAYQLVEWGQPAEFVDVPVPVPRGDEVLIRMRGAGLCRSDLDIMDAVPGMPPYANVLPARFTIGHENAGVVEMLGDGVCDLMIGEAVVAHHMHTCGNCEYCHEGHEQSCQTFRRGSLGITRGLGLDGGLAPFMLIPRRELVRLTSLDPVVACPLTDAGVTAYSAVKSGLHRLRPGSVAVVIGLGGLGAYALQFLKLLSCATIIGIDKSRERLAGAVRYGADHVVPSDDQAGENVMDLTRGRGADVVIDLVGTNDTLALAASVSRAHGRIILVGMEGGSLSVGWWSNMATTCEFTVSLGSTRADLREVCALAAADKLIIDLERFTLDQAGEAYARLRAGALTGRAVVTFD